MGLLNYIATKCYGDYKLQCYMIWCVCYSLLWPKSEFAGASIIPIIYIPRGEQEKETPCQPLSELRQ